MFSGCTNRWLKVRYVLTGAASPHALLGQNQTNKQTHKHLRHNRGGGDMKSECTSEVNLTQYQLVFGEVAISLLRYFLQYVFRNWDR